MRSSIVASFAAVIGSFIAFPAYAEGGVRFISSGENASTPFTQVPAAPIAFNSTNTGNALNRPASTPGLVNGVGGAAFVQNTAGTPAAVRFERPVGEIPEPTTWAMMLVGFGAVGYATRRRRRENVAFS